jgi:hypothetical protein
MTQHIYFATLVTAMLAAGRGPAGEPPCPDGGSECCLRRFAPVGGWNAYGGGLLHWWPTHCFPCAGAPDDYCQKPLPKVCWPSYPPYYIWGPPEVCPRCAAAACGTSSVTPSRPRIACSCSGIR